MAPRESDFISGSIAKSAESLRQFSHDAMATTFEILIVHNDKRYAQQAAMAAFDELDRLETELSRFIENSDISQINNLAAGQSGRVGLDVFECLKRCSELYKDTNGAFDITVGLLVDYWKQKGQLSQTAVESKHIGMDIIKLDDEGEHSVRVAEPVEIDLGGFGKGYAVDKMAELLVDWGIENALIHGGGSSVFALGQIGSEKGWPVTVSNPSDRKETLAKVCLKARALSGSGLEKDRHIIDPRTGKPVEDKVAAWACADDAATADGLSTAFMVMQQEEIERYCRWQRSVSAMVVLEEGQKREVLRFGSWQS